MARNLRKFETLSDYQSAELIRPAVSLIGADNSVHFDQVIPPTPPTFQGKWKATYTGGTTSSAECDSTSAITENEITLTDLETVEIGNCVTSFSNSLFMNCSSLTAITLSSSLTSISPGAFVQCTGLISIDIPDSVTSIGNMAFGQCSGLTSITCNATTPPTLGSSSFDNGNNCPILVPAQSLTDYQSAWTQYASRIQAIPNS